MSQIYIIGGGPGSGKSSVARALHKKYGYRLVKCDELVGPHQQEAADEKYPINAYINSLDEKDQPLELIKLTAKQELTRQEELFFMFIKELRRMKFNNLIIEGNCLLPRLIKDRFEFPYEAVWLVPTRSFQNKIYLKRDWAVELLSESNDPALTLQGWLKRDAEFNRIIKQQAKDCGFAYLSVDGEKDLDHTISWVKQALELP